MIPKKFYLPILVSCLLVNIVFSLFAQVKQPDIKQGIWQGVLHRPDSANIIFNFTVSKENNKPVLYIHNAGERLLVDSIRQQGDSLFIQMPFFASRFRARISENGNWSGSYVKNYGAREMIMPFTAVFNKAYRYEATAAPAGNITGAWQATFAGNDTLSNDAIGEFIQHKDGTVTGTFRTTTGDYRYLEGRLNGTLLQLSGFDGGHAILFSANMKNDNTLSDGVLYSGLTAKESWSAVKNSNAKLPDSYSITHMRPGEKNLSFTFPSTDNKIISLSDTAYKNKIVIVQILGSWCPNCMDETSFLSQYYKANKQKGIEMIGLAYERTENVSESKEALQPFRKRFDVRYPFLITGATVSDSLKTEKTLPQVDEIKAFPTTIFINKKGEVDKIHTGYDGPATGVHYEEFKKEFDEEINKLLRE